MKKQEVNWAKSYMAYQNKMKQAMKEGIQRAADVRIKNEKLLKEKRAQREEG